MSLHFGGSISNPTYKTTEVIDFVDFLKSKKERDIKGTSEVILRHCGGWKFREGELDNILEEIQKLREIEE